MTDATAVDHRPDFTARFRKRALCLLSLGLISILGHAFVPLEEFLHRGDDAFYYFKVALNYPEYGFWTFDGIHPTNGVQPLWAAFLCTTAQVLAWLDIRDPDFLARVFVFETAAIHFAGCMLLFRLLERHVSLATAIAAAGALLFPLGIVWTHVWGMENSLSLLLLVGIALFYQEKFLERGTLRDAALLGLLLALAALCRLSSGLLIPTLLAFYLFGRHHGSFGARLKRCTWIGAIVSALIGPYLIWNLVETGHLLPVSGAVKTIRSAQLLETHEVPSRLSWDFLSFLYEWTLSPSGLRWNEQGPLAWFYEGRILDGSWIVGGRIPTSESTSHFANRVLLAGLLVPCLALRPRAWLSLLWARLRRLGPFGYLAAFALLHLAVSLVAFPAEANYPLVRWWLVESEVALVVLTGLLLGTAVEFLGRSWIPARARLRAATLGLTLLVGFHVQDSLRFYWDREVQHPDWNASTNDARFLAGRWIQANLPHDALVGSWNAGVLGYYIDCHVVNLDGLINSWEFLPYLRDGELALYIREEGVQYLADTSFELNARGGAGLAKRLALSSLYRAKMDLSRTGLSYKNQHFLVLAVRD